MIVIHFAKVSTMYSRVVISSLAKRLENLLYAILHTSFGVWSKNHYMTLQRSTIGVCHALLRFPPQPLLAMLRFPPQAPIAPGGSQVKISCHSHSFEQDTQPIVFLISKQAVSYQTCDGTCYPGVSTPKIRSLVDLSNHITRWT
jgi:hypothetical protein